MLIEKMQDFDLEAVAECEKRLMTSPWQMSDFQHELSDNPFAHLFVLKDEQRLIGYMVMFIMYEQAEIATIGVDVPFQMQGHGQKLLEYALDLARKQHVEVMSLEVRISNQAAIRLYQNNGFSIRAVRPHYYQDNFEDAYLMVKEMEGNS